MQVVTRMLAISSKKRNGRTRTGWRNISVANNIVLSHKIICAVSSILHIRLPCLRDCQNHIHPIVRTVSQVALSVTPVCACFDRGFVLLPAVWRAVVMQKPVCRIRRIPLLNKNGQIALFCGACNLHKARRSNGQSLCHAPPFGSPLALHESSMGNPPESPMMMFCWA